MCNGSTLYVQSANQICNVYSFIRSKDTAWASQCRNGSRDHDHAHLGGQLVITKLVLHVTNSFTKVEVASCSRCRNGGVKF